MNDKNEIRQYLNDQFSASGDNTVQIIQSDFDRILNSAASCILITLTDTMPTLAERLHAELKSLHIKTEQDLILKVCYNPDSELSFDDLYLILMAAHKFAPQVNIVWGCGTDARLLGDNFSILLLIGISTE